jgi:hypothetical protein
MRVREEGLRWIYNYITLRNQWWLSWFEILRMRTKVKALKREMRWIVLISSRTNEGYVV